jgi:hypothetical protein
VRERGEKRQRHYQATCVSSYNPHIRIEGVIPVVTFRDIV